MVLNERVNRTTEDLEAVEKRQRGCLDDFEPQHSYSAAEEVTASDMGELEDAKSMGREAEQEDEELTEPRFASMIGRSLHSELNRSEGSDIEIGTAIDDAPLIAERRLEHAARGVLLDVQDRHGLGAVVTAHGTPIPPPGVLSAAADFATKTNAALKDSFRQDPATRLWVCTLTYESALRKLSASGQAANGKKVARKLAAARLVADLIEGTDPAVIRSTAVGTNDEASTDDTLDEQDDEVVEASEQQSASTDGLDTGVDFGPSEKSDVVSDIATDDARWAAQWFLECAARSVLLDVQDKPFPSPGAVGAARDFAAQTYGSLEESFRHDPATRLWVCTLTYESALRKLSASGQAVTDIEVARELAAVRLVASLIERTDQAVMESAAVASNDEASGDDTWNEREEDAVGTSGQQSVNTDGRETGVELYQSEWSDFASDIATDDHLFAARRGLERAARGVLLDVQELHGLDTAMATQGKPIPPPGVLSAARDFALQTDAVLAESFRQDPATRLWACTMSYESTLRKLSASGQAVSSKKIARKLAAARLIADLLAVVPA